MKQLKNTELKSKVKFFFKKNGEFLLDVILFGSVLKGKSHPNDVDLLVIFKNKVDLKVSRDFKLYLKDSKISITEIAYSDLFDEAFFAKEGIFNEGYSLIYDKKISEGFGFSTYTIFRYSILGLSETQKILFHYSLQGRKKGTGLLNEIGAFKLSDNMVICNVGSVERLKEHFEFWKIEFVEIPVLIPSRLDNIVFPVKK